MTGAHARPAAVLAVAVALALTACTGGASAPSASRTETAATSGAPAASSTASAAPASRTASTAASPAPRVARVGVLAPLEGSSGRAGRGLRDSVELAVRTANQQGTVPGWRFEVVAVDDGGNQSAGQQSASRLAGTAGLVGVVGSLSSAVDEGVQPIFASAGVPMLAPAAGAVHLTRRLKDGREVRPFPTYLRLAPTERGMQAAAARAARRAGARRVALVHDGTAAGQADARSLRAALRRERVRVVLERPASERAAAAVVRVARRGRGLDLVLWTGTGGAAAEWRAALSAAGARVPVLGGAALLGPQFSSEGGLARAGDLALVGGVAPEASRTADDFLRRYAAAGFDQPPGAYGATGYDAATALVQAFGAVVGSRTTVGGAVRADVAERLGRTDLRGASGRLRLDRFGDRVAPRATVYRMTRAGRWRATGTVSARP